MKVPQVAIGSQFYLNIRNIDTKLRVPVMEIDKVGKSNGCLLWLFTVNTLSRTIKERAQSKADTLYFSPRFGHNHTHEQNRITDPLFLKAPPHTQDRSRKAVPNPSYIFICVELSLKGVTKTVLGNCWPNKVEMAVHGNTSLVKRIKCAVTVKKKS